MTDQTTNQNAEGEEEDFAEFESKVMSGEADTGASKEPVKPKAGEEPLELGSEEAPAATPEEIEAEAQKTRSRPWQKRVDILTARLRDAERRASEAESRATGAKAAEGEAPKAPDPDDPKYEFGAADPDYIKDSALFQVKKDLADERKETLEKDAANAARGEVAAKIEEGMAKAEAAGAEKYDDFEEKIAAAVDARGGEPIHPLIGIGISISPVGADVAYKLATDETASERIEKLAKSDPLKAAQAFGELEGEFTDEDDDLNLVDPLDMARALGRMRGRLKGSSKASGGSAEAVERTTTKAPKPPEHRARGGSGQFEVADDTDDFGAFEKKHMGRRK